MKTYKHLSLYERNKIGILQGEGKSIRSIAKILKRSASTIQREINRENADKYRGKYIQSTTHKRVKEAWSESHKRKNTFLNQRNVSYFIECELKRDYSPDIICHELLELLGETVSNETLYKYIYSKGWKLTQYLRRSKFGRQAKKTERPKKQGTGKNIPNRVDIDLRPIEANLRIEFGHFEADSIEGTRKRVKQGDGKHIQKRKSCLTVVVDRVSRLTKIIKTASLTSMKTSTSILKAMKPYRNTIKSITYDNGKEFSKHEIINKEFNIKSYFCKPYHSWEKGTVENINGIIRRFFPKGTDFDMITNKQIKCVEDWINNRPMKVLGYLTPNEKYLELI